MEQSPEKLNSTEKANNSSKKCGAFKTSFSILGFLCGFLALLLTVGLFYYFKQLNLMTNQQQNQATIQNLSNDSTKLQQKLTELQTTLEHVQAYTTNTNTDWILAEVNYLVHLAQYNLNFQRDVVATIKLLQTAEEKIKNLPNPTLLQLRDALVHDITLLQAIPKTDFAGILSRINALDSEVEQLPFIATHQPVQNQTLKTEEKTTEKLPWWKEGLVSSWTSIKKLIVIRRHDEPVEPSPTPLQQATLIQSLHLQFQKMQWAVLRQNSSIYQSSLEQIVSTINRYFAIDETNTKALLDATAELKKINIQPELPNINDTFKALEDAQKAAQTSKR